MAFTAVAALVAAEAVTVTMVLAAVAEVGLALTVVGAVTGNETLLKIGGAMSLIGGVGGMIAGAAGAGTGAAATGLSEAATTTALEAASSEAASAFGGSAAAEAATAEVVAGMEGAAATGADLAASTASEGIVGSSMQATASEGLQAVPKLEVGPTVDAARTVNDISTPQAPVGAKAPVTPADVGVRSPTSAPEAAGSFFGKISTFAEKNKTLFSSGLQMVGGAMKGANERDMWDQKMAVERERLAQTSYGNQVAQFYPTRGIVGGAR